MNAETTPAALVAWLALTMGAGCSTEAFVCSSDDQCGGGFCEADGFCSFEDGECDSGRRYGQFAGGGLAGSCVPDGVATGTSGGGDSATSTSGAGTDSSTSNGATTLDPSGGGSSGDDTVGNTDTAGPADVEFTDDEWDGEFAAGTVVGLVWEDVSVRLDESGDVGTLASRVFDAGRPVQWTSLRWNPRAPYGRPLPGPADSETYESGNADMTDNVLLYRFDAPGGGAGTTIVDASGAGNDGSVTGSGFSVVPGRFAGAYAHGGGAYVDVPLSPSVVPGSDDFTWAFWWRSDVDACDADGATLMAFDSSSNEPFAPAVWIHCTNFGGGAPCSGDGTIWGNVARRHDGVDVRVCGSITIDDGQWHHIAMVKTGLDNVTARVYVDGQLDASDSANVGGPIEAAGNTQMTVGGQQEFSGVGEFDEVAIWRRALDEDEIRDLYLRGARRVWLQVRACDDPTCAGSTFVGPSGENSAFIDLADPQIPLMGQSGQFVQYALQLERDSGVSSPAVESVTILGSD